MRAITKAIAAAALLFAAFPAAAQTSGPGYGPAAKSFQISPFVGYRFGGGFDRVDYDDDFSDLIDVEIDDGGVFGVVFDARLSEGLFLELWASRQQTELGEDAGLFLPPEALFDIDVDYYHAGLIYEWTPGQVRPFFGFSAGATRFIPDGPGLDELIRPSFSFGGGVKVMFSEAVGLRLEGRWISTWVEAGDDEFCDHHSCYDFDQDVYFYQIETGVGLVVAF